MTKAIQQAETEIAQDVKTVMEQTLRKFEDKVAEIENRIVERMQRQFDAVGKICATKAELSEVKAELIRWMFVFWVGQIAATVAIVKFLR